jgi:hypothetical protein
MFMARGVRLRLALAARDANGAISLVARRLQYSRRWTGVGLRFLL